jgi:C4-dicarboxylate-specific signal transduction histidine kinase
MEGDVRHIGKHLLLVALLLTVVCGPVFVNNLAAEEAEPIRIGVLAYRGKVPALERWSATAAYLSDRIGRQFEIVPVNLDEIADAINSGRIQFTLTNPGNYVSLEARFGASRIATMQTREQGRTHVRYGAVIVALAANPDIQSLSDLKGRSFMAVSPVAFGGFQMAWRELIENGIDPFSDFGDLQFAGFPQDKIIHAIQNGEVDAATVRAETLMRMVEAGTVQLDEFRILNPQHEKDSSLPLSTRLYPEWPFATMKDTPRELATRVAQALLSMPPDHPAARASRTVGWTVPLDYSPVHRLMKTLKIGPYEVLRQTSFTAVLKRYAGWFAAAALLLLLLIILNGYISRTNRKLKHAQSVLRDEITQRKRSQEALARYRDTLEEQVTERTEDLKETNRALEKSRIALRELVRITSAPDSSHDEKLARLLDTGREYFGLPVAVLASVETNGQQICRIAGDTGLVPEHSGQLSGKCVSRLLECKGEPLDIPDLEEDAETDCGCQQKGWKSYLGAAVMVDGRIHCTLEFAGTHARSHVFSKWDHELLKVMAQWIGDEVELRIAHESQQRHQAEFARVSRMSTIGEMAASLAHELNQPLTGAINYCSGCLRMLREGNTNTEKLTQGMESAVEGATLAANIIRRVREFVQKGDAQLGEVDLNHAVRNVAALVKHEARRHDVIIKLDLDESLPLVLGDIIQLEQVVLNFIRNGIDAMDAVEPGSRNLTIRTRRLEEAMVMVSTIDSGKGIAEEAMPRIFDAFYTTKPDGMGIGLSISRSIIESHQGRIRARSLSDGGTEFFFELPVLQAS